MEALQFSSFQLTKNHSTKSPNNQLKRSKPFSPIQKPIQSLTVTSIHKNNKKRPNFTLFTSLSSPPSNELTDSLEKDPELDEKFDWYAQWYAVMPVCDLDKRAPKGKKVMGLDIVVWWDKNESSWKVFNDTCPHRLAPLSEGRIDQWGRLQCVYHGWCFGGSGDCKFIPQAPLDGPPVHTSKKACVAVYPSVVQNGIVWFWPNADPQYRDILSKKRPPYIPELDDPSFTRSLSNRDIPYGYDVLIDNLMDPAHLNYAHYGIVRIPKRKESVKADREGGQPMEINVEKLDVNGYIADQGYANTKFMAPCVFYIFPPNAVDPSKESVTAGTKERSLQVAEKKLLLVFFCIPVSPGNSRLILSFPRNFLLWADKLVPRWIFHLSQNLVLDSDMYLLHTEERKLMELGPSNWQKACFLPTKADAQVVAFRKWFNKYAGGQVDWRTTFTGALPPSPPKEQLMDRYWSHVVNCRSCSVAYKGLNALEVVLQVVSVALIGIVAASKQNMLPVIQRNVMISVAVLCFVGSRWLSHFVYKNFRFHDYSHAFR